jgi:ABC-type transporter Mla subunit MlaD
VSTDADTSPTPVPRRPESKRRLLLGLVIVGGLLALVLVLALTGGDDTGDRYRVRAIFDNASTLVGGEDVKVAGAPVGVVEHMDVTADKRAAVTLRIDNPGFTPFKADATCTIRLQGLIGERFVECEPGTTRAPALRRIEHGDTPSGGTGGQGEHLLPVTHTSSPVDLDLVGNVMRLPYRERLAIVLDEFGTGLAGRGKELNEVIHRANPALRQTEQVVRILARQNRTLVQLARDSDRALAPLARERRRVSDFIVQANATGTASAERSDDIRSGIDQLPEFLRQLRPLMVDLGRFATDATPVVANLGSAAPDLARLIKGQGELADAGRQSFPSLGDALERGGPALIAARPLIRNLGQLGRNANPVSKSLDQLTASLDKTGGAERLVDVLYYIALSTNGFDAIGHYLRAGLVTNTCSNYTLKVSAGCNATFYDSSSGSAATAARNAPQPTGAGGSVKASAPLLQQLLGSDETQAQAEQRARNQAQLRKQAAQPSPGLGPANPALDYLLGAER